MTILIIHGIGGHAGIHWQAWLKNQLESRGHTVLMPEMPNPDKPDRTTWLNVIKNTLTGIEHSSLVLLGHSLGATTALDYIEQSDQSVQGLVSVSGFANDYGAELNGYFLTERVMNFSNIVPKIKQSVVVYGSDDPYVTQEALIEVANGLQADPIIINEGGHLNTEVGYTEFPQLLTILEEKLLP